MSITGAMEIHRCNPQNYKRKKKKNKQLITLGSLPAAPSLPQISPHSTLHKLRLPIITRSHSSGTVGHKIELIDQRLTKRELGFSQKFISPKPKI